MKKDVEIVKDKNQLCVMPILASKPKVQWAYVTGAIYKICNRDYALVALAPYRSAVIDVETGIPIGQYDTAEDESSLEGAEITGYTFNRSKKEVKLKVSAGSIGMDMNKLNELVESELGVTLVIIQTTPETNTPEGQTELFDDEGNPKLEDNDEERRN